MTSVRLRLTGLCFLLCCMTLGHVNAQNTAPGTPIQFGENPALNHNGSKLVFDWQGDLWQVDVSPDSELVAYRLTSHPGSESKPLFSPTGDQIAFASNRNGGWQIFVMPATGGPATQVNFHSEDTVPVAWYQDGAAILGLGNRDHFWSRPQRFMKFDLKRRRQEKVIFDAHGKHPSLSKNGRRLLFERNGVKWWRKGYTGSRAAQIWSFSEADGLKLLVSEPTGARSPLFNRDESGFYFLGSANGVFNLKFYDFESKKQKLVTNFSDDHIVQPAMSGNGQFIVFRKLGDFYLLDTRDDKPARKLNLTSAADSVQFPKKNRIVSNAEALSSTEDGLEFAFIAGGDLYVMDTELREPVQVTHTADLEYEPVFSKSGEKIFFVSDKDGQSDIWQCEKAAPAKYWWQQETFVLKRVTNDPDREQQLSISPDGKLLAYVKGRGDLWLHRISDSAVRRVVKSWNKPDYDWAPDSNWLVYSTSDSDFNSEIFVKNIHNDEPAVNISMHPDRDSSPRWSPDGKIIAFRGNRQHDETDVYYVYLNPTDEFETNRDRKLEKALKKMKKRKNKSKGSKKKPEAKSKEKTKAAKLKPIGEKSDSKPIVVNLENIHRRIRRIRVINSTERQLLWSPEGDKLAFSASISGKSGYYVVGFEESKNPRFFSSSVPRSARWLKSVGIVGLFGGTPGIMNGKSGIAKKYGFKVRQDLNHSARQRAAFDFAWRVMRDNFYDEDLNGKNWDDIRRKYQPLAKKAIGPKSFATVINLMLGELNGSHLGFSAYPESQDRNFSYREMTAHLGLRWDPNYNGPGIKVRNVLPDGPCSKARPRVMQGDLVTAIDGQTVDPDYDLTQVLNGDLERDIVLSVKRGEKSWTVTVRPTSYRFARAHVYKAWLEQNRAAVEKLSNGKLGYIYVRSMNWSSFQDFERELYAVGAGKSGLVIDVRNNGGGWTTDHLLTVLSQPRHAITVPRGGQAGYPQDRIVYATWHKPIVVLCNENSFSNAEIFSHAIKQLKRGRLVGVPTAGGVISTGMSPVLDMGYIRVPFRGWYTFVDGEDMELNGAKPDILVTNPPTAWPTGEDKQLKTAVEALLEDVKAWQSQPKPRLKKAYERRR